MSDLSLSALEGLMVGMAQGCYCDKARMDGMSRPTRAGLCMGASKAFAAAVESLVSGRVERGQERKGVGGRERVGEWGNHGWMGGWEGINYSEGHGGREEEDKEGGGREEGSGERQHESDEIRSPSLSAVSL